MSLHTFIGARKPLDGWDIPMLAHRLKTGEDELRAFLEVEARSQGYDRLGRPVMLFEPHVFYRNLHDPAERDEAVKAGLAYPRWGAQPYPKDSYPRLEAACAINETAALMACSIGLSQVLVENYASVGYKTPHDMWRAFMNDEQEHVEAMVRFILVNNIDDDLRAHRWSTVARVYNGPGYKKHNYDGRMASAFAKFARQEDTVWSPDGNVEGAGDATRDELRDIQRKLRDLGYVEAGKADGRWGTKTRAAVLAFRADNGLPITPSIDDQFKAALIGAKPRGIGEERAATTAEDLRREGSRTVVAADGAQAGGAVVGLAGLGGVVASAQEQLFGVQSLFDSAGPLMDTVKTMGPYVLLAIGAFIAWKAYEARQARVDDERTGKNAGRP